MFTNKAGTYLGDAPFRCSTLGQIPSLIHKHQTWLERPAALYLITQALKVFKHSALIIFYLRFFKFFLANIRLGQKRPVILYQCKEFYCTLPPIIGFLLGQIFLFQKFFFVVAANMKIKRAGFVLNSSRKTSHTVTHSKKRFFWVFNRRRNTQHNYSQHNNKRRHSAL